MCRWEDENNGSEPEDLPYTYHFNRLSEEEYIKARHMRHLYILVMMVYGIGVSAQIDTLLSEVIEPLTITVQPYQEHVQVYKLEDSPGPNLISDLLESQSNVYIKSYGSGSLATLSLRGGNASQTQLQWEGIPINNPMLGISDLSLVPLNLFSYARLTKGGHSAQSGSGAMTGILDMRNNYHTGQLEVDAYLSAGSFGEWTSQIKIAHGSEKASIAVRGFLEKSENDFTYQLSNGDTRDNSNAEYQSKGVLASAHYAPSEYDRFSLSIWLQSTDRGIPPTTVQNSSNAFQDDILSRHKLSYVRTFNRINLESQVAYFDEQNNFTDPDRLTEAENRFKTFYTEGLVKTTTKNNHSLKYEYSHTSGTSKSYADVDNDFRRFALIAQTSSHLKNLKINAALRKEWNNIVNAPLIPSTTLSYTKQQFITSLKLSREFRSPTLNELYWQPVGNLDLQPELGWNQELNVSIQYHKKLPNLSLTSYHRKINNWILWIPLNGNNGIWGPTNLTSVRSYGVDFDLDHDFSLYNGLAQVSTGYAYTKSINLSTVNQHGIQEGDQLIYTPVHKSYISLSYAIKKLKLNYIHNYTSGVTGINENLSGYTVGNAMVQYAFKSTSLEHQIDFNINNIYNSQYRIIERRPMPGRHFRIGWAIKFKKEK